MYFEITKSIRIFIICVRFREGEYFCVVAQFYDLQTTSTCTHRIACTRKRALTKASWTRMLLSWYFHPHFVSSIKSPQSPLPHPSTIPSGLTPFFCFLHACTRAKCLVRYIYGHVHGTTNFISNQYTCKDMNAHISKDSIISDP